MRKELIEDLLIRRLWLLGFAIFISSNVLGSVFQLASLSIVILAPLGAVRQSGQARSIKLTLEAAGLAIMERLLCPLAPRRRLLPLPGHWDSTHRWWRSPHCHLWRCSRSNALSG